MITGIFVLLQLVILGFYLTPNCLGGTMATREQLFAKVKHNPSKWESARIDELRPFIANAIKTAEGNPRNHGVLSVPTKDSEEASQVLDNSINNNYMRWIQAGRPESFVNFMQQRWAPIGAKNDPKNLNKNWTPNVAASLKQSMTDDDYKWFEQVLGKVV